MNRLKALVKTQLIKHEGVVLQPYYCPSGKLTIGIGRNLETKGISRTEALFLLDNDINECEAILQEKLKHVYDHLSFRRKAVLINMCFNLGFYGLLAFKNMMEALIDQDYEKASAEMLDSKWADQVGNRALELAEIMREG